MAQFTFEIMVGEKITYMTAKTIPVDIAEIRQQRPPDAPKMKTGGGVENAVVLGVSRGTDERPQLS